MCTSLFGRGFQDAKREQLEQLVVTDIAEEDQTTESQTPIIDEDQMVSQALAGQEWPDT